MADVATLIPAGFLPYIHFGRREIDRVGGYLDSEGRPTQALLGEIQLADVAIGRMVETLGARGLLDSTLIIITAKQDQSPARSLSPLLAGRGLG